MTVYPSKKKYDEENLLRVTVGFNRRTEPELVERLEREKNRAGYLRRLVQADLEREKKNR